MPSSLQRVSSSATLNPTIDHASLLRRSTIPIPYPSWRHLQYSGAHLVFFHTLNRDLLLTISPSCFAVCGHHLFPSIAVVFSLLSNASNDFTVRTNKIVISLKLTILTNFPTISSSLSPVYRFRAHDSCCIPSVIPFQ